MTVPSWAEVEQFIGAELPDWQKALVASMLSGPPGHPLSFVSISRSRGWGKVNVDRWAMWSAHHFELHTHFCGREAVICVAKTPHCPDTIPYDPQVMKP